MGEAYLLMDGRVLKILREEFAQDAAFRGRFQTEVELQKSVRSPHVPRVWTEGEYKGRSYFVMDHHPGKVLSRSLEEDLRISLALVGSDLLQALSACHLSGVVHRDLKADNVIVAPAGIPPGVSLIDFGVACEARAGGRSETQWGSPCTWGPERLLGFDGTDTRSDLFSVGVLLFTLVARAHPFGYGTPAWRGLMTLCEVPPLRAFVADATGLDRFFQRALAKALDARFPSAQSMREAWNEACAQASTA